MNLMTEPGESVFTAGRAYTVGEQDDIEAVVWINGEGSPGKASVADGIIAKQIAKEGRHGPAQLKTEPTVVRLHTEGIIMSCGLKKWLADQRSAVARKHFAEQNHIM